MKEENPTKPHSMKCPKLYGEGCKCDGYHTFNLKSDYLDINENAEIRYFKGWINRIIRIYYYLQQGLNQLNNTKNVFLGLIALGGYLGFKSASGLSNKQLILLAMIGMGALLVAILVGYLWVKRGKMSTEYFDRKYTSPYGRYGIKIQDIHLDYFIKNGVPVEIKTAELLQKILDKLNEEIT